MNKKPILIAVVVILLLLIVGGAGYFYLNKGKTEGSPTEEMQESNGQQLQESQSGGVTTLKNLLMSGNSQTCTYSSNSNNITVNGTVYISGGKVRGDFTSEANGQTSTGHNIYDGKTTYVWTDGATTGYMMDVNPSTQESTSTSGDQTQESANMEQPFDYKCQPWTPNETYFKAPPDVKFASFAVPTTTAETLGGQISTTPSTSDLCASCDALTGDQKTQCLTALKCN